MTWGFAWSKELLDRARGFWVEEHCQISHQLARIELGFLDLESLSKPLLHVVST